MKSGGNCAPIDRQRSWSHSWMSESAGQGGGGEQREAERGDPAAAVGLFKSDSLDTHTHARRHTAPSLSVFTDALVFSFIYTAPFGPMCVWEVRTSVTAHWERVTAFYIYPETQSDGEKGSAVGKVLGSQGHEVKSRGEREFGLEEVDEAVDSCQF